jgi:class 3 adenylate cyclase/CheY-like chemotaxis protein
MAHDTVIQATARTSADPTGADPGAAPRRILIVDDSFIMRKLVRGIVESDPDLVVADVAENGRIALQKVREVKPDLILLDIEMPEMSGLEALRRLGLRCTSKVVILSSLGVEGSAEAAEAMRLGAAAVLAKPSGSVSLDIEQREGARILRTVRAVLGLPPRPDPAENPAAQAVTSGAAEPASKGVFHGAFQDVLLGALGCGVMVFDSTRRLSVSNEAAARLTGRASLRDGPLALDDLFEEYNEDLGATIRAVLATGEKLERFATQYALPDGGWQPVALTALPVPTPGGGGKSVMVLLEDLSREEEVARLLSNTLSSDVANKLLRDGRLSLGGKVAQGAILFADIRSFTSLSEALGAEGIVALLNEYFSYMEDILKSHGGVIDKYIGDAIMALFGLPEPLGDDADRAVRGGLGMLSALDTLNASRAARGAQPIHIGIGIAMGDVVAGNIGSPTRMNYTVIGDAVNLAARIESLTKRYGAELMICETTMGSLREPIAARKADLVRVVGQTKPALLYQVLRADRPADPAWLAAYERGFAAYMAGEWDRALSHLAEAVALNGADKAAKLLIDRCHKLKREPPDAWDGVWTHQEK